MEYEILKNDPGNPVFADYAEELRLGGRFSEAIEVCLKGLSANPSCHRGRLILARVFFERGFVPFAAREVNILRETLPELKSVQRLYEKFYPDVAEDEGGEATIAESDFEISELEMVGEEKK